MQTGCVSRWHIFNWKILWYFVDGHWTRWLSKHFSTCFCNCWEREQRSLDVVLALFEEICYTSTKFVYYINRKTNLLIALLSERVGWTEPDVTSMYCIRHIALNSNKDSKNVDLKKINMCKLLSTSCIKIIYLLRIQHIYYWFLCLLSYDMRWENCDLRQSYLHFEWWYDCGEFQALWTPCLHAIASCASCNLNYNDFIDSIYKLENIFKVY